MRKLADRIARIVAFAAFAFTSLSTPAAPLRFVAGDIYSTQFFGTDINQYSPTGSLLGTTPISGLRAGEATKGLGFGPDGSLYVVLDRLFEGARLVSIGPNGSVLNSYELPTSTGGNISYGKLSFGPDNSAYIGTGSGLVRVDLGNATSARFVSLSLSIDVFDISVLPNGDLLVLSDNDLNEFNAGGSLVRHILLSDPNHVSAARSFFVNNLRGLEYDAASNRVFVSMLGNSDNLFFQTMAFDFATGTLQNIGTFVYGDDMFLADNTLLLGSRTETPWILSPADLSVIGRLGGGERMFVTRDLIAAVPEPGSLWLLAAGLLIGSIWSTCGRAVRRSNAGGHGRQLNETDLGPVRARASTPTAASEFRAHSRQAFYDRVPHEAR